MKTKEYVQNKTESEKKAFGEGVADVYIAFKGGVPKVISAAEIYDASEKFSVQSVPDERMKEIETAKSEKVKNEKLDAWKLLSFAIEKSFGLEPAKLAFSKTENGKPVCDKLWFSISHSHGVYAVIVSDKPCGIDVEYKTDFLNKCAYKSFIEAFSRRIGEEKETCGEELLRSWTAKESVYKRGGEGAFLPRSVKPSADTETFEAGNYVFSVTSELKDEIRTYFCKI